MKAFMNQDFLLSNETARTLYHTYAEQMPIFDYHNHLSAQEIYEDKGFTNLTRAWLYGDHYKWRAMRTAGFPEELVTGPPRGVIPGGTGGIRLPAFPCLGGNH